MDLIHYFLLGLVALFAIAYINKGKSNKQNRNDPYLDKLIYTSQRIANDNKQLIDAYEKGLNDKYSADAALRDRVVRSIQKLELDKALLIVFDKHHSIPSLKKAKLVDSGKSRTAFKFKYYDKNYQIVCNERSWSNPMDSGTDYILTLEEDGDPVFEINSSYECNEYGCEHSGGIINLVKRRGTWESMLLECMGEHLLYWEKSRLESKYWQVKDRDIKNKFQE